MGALFIIIFVLPVVAAVGLIVAIVNGFRAKNRKRYFISLGVIVGIAAFLVSTLFVDYKGIVVNAFASTKVPAEYRDYHHLRDTVTPDFSITALQGRKVTEIFTDSLTGKLIVVTLTEGYGSPDQEFYYRIDPDGSYCCFERPEDIYRRGRYLIGEHGWCDWIATGDTTIKAYTPVKLILSRKTLRPLYDASDYAELFSDSTCVLHRAGGWYSCKLDFTTDYYTAEKEYEAKDTYALTHLIPRQVDITTPGHKEEWWDMTYLNFNEYPVEASQGALCFDYFGKQEYDSGFSRFLSGIGNPTGGNSRFEKWYGTGYFRLRIGQTSVPFAYSMTHEIEWDKTYQAELSIYTAPSYAILAGSEGVYLISIK